MKATDFLHEGRNILAQRGKEYETTEPNQERSFGAAADAFNAITGRGLRADEVCLMLQILKDVRQYSQPHRAHMDSLIDCVNYASLKAEAICDHVAQENTET